jgi:hypothetical protein
MWGRGKTLKMGARRGRKKDADANEEEEDGVDDAWGSGWGRMDIIPFLRHLWSSACW